MYVFMYVHSVTINMFIVLFTSNLYTICLYKLYLSACIMHLSIYINKVRGQVRVVPESNSDHKHRGPAGDQATRVVFKRLTRQAGQWMYWYC